MSRKKDVATRHNGKSDKNVPPLSTVHVLSEQESLLDSATDVQPQFFHISSRSQWVGTSGKSKSINHSQSGLEPHRCDPTCCSKQACSKARDSRHLAKPLFLTYFAHFAHHTAWPLGSRDGPATLAGIGGVRGRSPAKLPSNGKP